MIFNDIVFGLLALTFSSLFPLYPSIKSHKISKMCQKLDVCNIKHAQQLGNTVYN